MSWENILKNKYELDRTEIQPFERDAEDEFEVNALRRDIEYEYEPDSPDFKKAQEKLFNLVNITIPQDERMLQILGSNFSAPVTRQELKSATQKIYADLRELSKIKKEAEEHAKKNPQYGPVDDNYIQEFFQDSESKYAQNHEFERLMDNKIGDTQLGFSRRIITGINMYKELFRR